MASTYSPSLRLELMATGDQSGTWGDTTNTNLGTLLEQAITGFLSVAQGDVANLTLTALDGASDQSRNMVVELTGAMSAGRNVVVPTAEKVYLIKNSTTGGFSVTVKTAAGSGVAVLPSASQWVYCDGTNVVAGLLGTGTGLYVQQTTPTLITPVLGVATATSINKVALTAPATSATLTIADGATLTASDSTTVSANQRISTITYVIDGGGSTITTGVKGDLEIPFACTITRSTLLADQSGSIVVDIWKDTYANYPPTVADTITASAKPTISATTKAQDATLTGWTTAIAAGDTLRFNVDSITTCTRVTLSLRVTRT